MTKPLRFEAADLPLEQQVIDLDAVEALQAVEFPEAGFPSDRSNDAERIRPGLADFARGA